MIVGIRFGFETFMFGGGLQRVECSLFRTGVLKLFEKSGSGPEEGSIIFVGIPRFSPEQLQTDHAGVEGCGVPFFQQRLFLAVPVYFSCVSFICWTTKQEFLCGDVQTGDASSACFLGSGCQMHELPWNNFESPAPSGGVSFLGAPTKTPDNAAEQVPF